MILITFEGIDASGKTTQLKLLSQKLVDTGIDLVVTRQPGGTRVGTQIREILLNPEHQELDSTAEVLLYIADRIQHINEVIKPALKQNKVVLCDRYHDATLAYQGGGRKLDLGWLEPLAEQSITKPDLTFWFDIPVEISRQRLFIRNQQDDVENCRIEEEQNEFFQRVRDKYHELCQDNPDRYVRIDATQKIETIQAQIYNIIKKKLTKTH